MERLYSKVKLYSKERLYSKVKLYQKERLYSKETFFQRENFNQRKPIYSKLVLNGDIFFINFVGWITALIIIILGKR